MDTQIEQTSRTKVNLQILSTLLALCLVLAACGPAPTAATEPPALTEPPATEAPATEAPAAAELPVTDCGTLLPPEDCNPEWRGAIEYTALAQLPTGECEIRLLDQGVGQCSMVTYTDVNGQVCTISVEGADAAAVQEYLQDASAYFTVQRVGGGVTPPTDINFPSLVTILVETTTERTGQSQEELVVIRDGLIAERGEDIPSVNLADVSIAVSSDPDEILKAATERAVSEFLAAAQTAGLTQEEIDQLVSSISEEMRILMFEPGAGFLLDPAAAPQDNAGYSAILTNHPTDLAITLDWASAPPEEGKLWLIWFSIDPTIAANTYHFYKEKCSIESASVSIGATAGSMTNYFWRLYPYYYSVGARTANIQATALPPGMTHSSSPNRRSYDTSVKGGPSGGTYYISGGWVQGFGCQQ